MAPPAASCGDGLKNGAETDVDCGGGACPACGAGKRGGFVQFASGSNMVGVATGDADGDGKSDVLGVSADAPAIDILLGVGDGHLKARNAYGAGAPGNALVANDLDGDGKLDVASALVDNRVAVLLNRCTK